MDYALTNFGGRMVYERQASATDGCYIPDDPPAPYFGLSGGGWWVQADNTYGADFIGFSSEFIDYYQNFYKDKGGCQITVSQEMRADTTPQTTLYRTNTININITPTQLCIARDTAQGSDAQSCENYPMQQ